MSDPIMAIAASGLEAQRLRMQVISTNLANMHTTRGADGKPYTRMVPVFRPEAVGETFADELDNQRQLYAVRVERVTTARREPLWVYDPENPDADENGYVGMPNINLVEEVTDMMNAARSYEANLAAMQTAKAMNQQALDLGRG